MSKRLIYAEDVTNALRNHVRGGHIILSYEYIKDMVLSLPSAQPQSCKDAVSKADVLETYAELYDVFDDNKEIKNELHKIYDKINALQAAQPQRMKGRWIDVTKTGGAELWKCSECGELELEDSYFCPNCGSDNRGEDDET